MSTFRAYLQNGGVSYRHDAPMLNDKYFPKDAYGGSNAYLGQTNVSIVPHGGMVTNGQGEYDGFKYPHLQLRNVSLGMVSYFFYIQSYIYCPTLTIFM